MSSSSKIEWTDATWNPVSGCSKVSQGCRRCYAERLWPKVAGAEAKRTGQPPRAFTDVRCHPERLDTPRSWRKPRRIFVNSMSDLFHEDVPDDFLAQVLCAISEASHHQFQVLTKRPARMLEAMTAWSRVNSCDFPLDNLWLGVSVEDQATADERIPILLQTPAAVRFVSYEPALGPVDFTRITRPIAGPGSTQPAAPPIDQVLNALTGYNGTRDWHGRGAGSVGERLQWIIAGGESGPGARPAHPDWFRSVRDQCAEAGIPFFFKQWGEWAPCDTDVDAGDYGRTLHPHEETVTDAMALIERGFSVTEAHGCEFFRAGKKLAGRTLDGRTHDEYPA